MISFQVTIGASATQVTTLDLKARQIIFQKTSANACRVGDKLVSSTRGLSLVASGAAGSMVSFGPFPDACLNLRDYWVQGTQNDIVDVMYVV